jgi:Winged helix DNA-binding domain
MTREAPARPPLPPLEVLRERLRNQGLARPEFRGAKDVVAWLGAVQAQDYAGAKWALGLRGPRLTDADVDRAFDTGAILRTHLMRPTWHFVAPRDIRWMLTLTAPRVHAANAFMYRKLGLEDATLTRSRKVLERALRGGKPLTRSELDTALRRAGIAADGLRLAYLMMHAELSGVICSGPRRGKQFTYARLDERAPRARSLAREEALGELTRRYFTSHGPATVRDFAWWSGLTVRDAKAGLEMVKPALVRELVGDLTYWLVATRSVAPPVSPSAYLLPNYDESLIAYRDRGLVVSDATGGAVPGRDAFAHHLLVDGRIAGSWRRTLQDDSVLLEAATYQSLTRSQAGTLAAAAERYSTFVGLPVTLKKT